MSRPAFDEAKSERIIRAVRESIITTGRAPTRRELAATCGLPRSTVHRYLTHLAEAGRIIINESRWRGLSFRT